MARGKKNIGHIRTAAFDGRAIAPQGPMSDMRERETSLSYAQPDVPAVYAKPFIMLPGNFAAVVIVFVNLTERQSPFDALVEFVTSVNRVGGFSQHFWDAIATAPFLISIPLAAWTLKLCFNPVAGRSQRVIVWSLSAASMTMTMLAEGYCVVHIERFMLPAAGFIIILGIFLLMLWRVRGLWNTYLPALIAVTGAFAINLLLVIWIVLTHSPLTVGAIIGLFVVVMQLVAATLMVRRYKGTETLSKG